MLTPNVMSQRTPVLISKNFPLLISGICIFSTDDLEGNFAKILLPDWQFYSPLAIQLWDMSSPNPYIVPCCDNMWTQPGPMKYLDTSFAKGKCQHNVIKIILGQF